MRRHQVLTGAVNPGECCFAVGYIEGVPFTAYASGCDIVILASNFERVQIIPGDKHGNIQVGCIDCSSENGKIAASYANQVYIYEPVYQPGKKSHLKLDYQWNLSGSFKVESLVSNLSWNQDGSRILTGSDAIQIWSHPTPDSDAEESDQGEANPSKDAQIWESIWQTKTATPVYNLKYSSDGQFFASAGKSDRLVKIWYQVHSPQTTVAKVNGIIEPKGENYSFIYLAHPRAVTGFSWRRTSKYLPRGTVANCLVTSCRDNICRVWRETLLPDINVISTSSKLTTGDGKAEAHSLYKRQHFGLGLKPGKKRRTPGANIPLSSVKHEHDLHKYYHGNKNHPNGYLGISIQVHFHIAATINPNTDIPLLPAIGTMSKGAAPNFVVNWLNNKELQFTLASEMLYQSTKDQGLIDTRTSGTDTTSQEMGSQESQSELDDDTDPSGKESTDGGSLDGGGIVISVPTQSPKSVQRPSSLETSPFSQKGLSDGGRDIFSPAVRAGFDALKREWQSSADMLYSIHPIDGSFLLWLVEWVDENIPGVHRQPLVSFSCRIPQAFPQFDATSLSGDLILYRSNLTLDHRVLERGRGIESPTELRAMTPSYSFVQKLSQVPEGTDIFAYTPKVSMLSKHSNGTLNQWEISFAEGSKFQTVLNVSHVNRSAGHRFQVNDLACHPVLPLLLTSSHHNIPKVDVDPDIATSRTRKSSVAARRASLAAKRGSVREPTGSFSLFGKNFLSQSEHTRLTELYEANLENTAKDLQEKDEVVVPDEIMDKLHSEMNWPDMSAPTGLCSELILWKVFHVGPLCKVGGVVELARINSPFISSFSHVSWLPSLLPSSCLPLQSNSPSACFVASDGYSLRLFQAVIDARSLLNEITPTSNQYEGYLSSSSPITPYLLREDSEEDETPSAELPRVVSLQSTSRPGCIIELDKLSEAKQNWQNVQLMHTFHKQFITGQSKTASLPSPPSVHSDPDIASFPSLHSNQFDECFYLVVIDRKDKGQSIIHMWYIRLRTEISKSKVLKDVNDSSDDDEDDSSVDALDEDSSDSTDVADTAQTNTSVSVSQISTRLRTYSRRVCSQVLELPEGVEIISASPAAGHLSSSCIYPACAAPYLLSTACSDGRLRFWTCRMEDGGSNAASPVTEGGPSSSSSDQSPSRTQTVDDSLARASYKWEEWELMVREDTQSDLKVKGQPVAVSCAYNGRIACAYRTDSASASGDNRVPLEVSIHECESTGGSEWIHEDTINLGRLNLDKMEVSPDKHTTTPTAELGYKIMKRSSKVEDFLSLSDDQEERGHYPRGLEYLGTGQDWNVNKLPVQLAWASKEDGSHLLTVGLGSKVTIFTPNLHDEEDCKPKWTPLSRVKLSCVDGVAPFSKMLSWVRAGILVVGLENEMHVYSQWSNPEEKMKAISRESKSKSHARADSSRAISRNESLISVNLQSLPMSRSEREQSYNDVTQLAKGTTDVGKPDPTVDGEEVDDGLFENSYKSCPVLPQYHPMQLMGLMNCGRINRVNAILSHLVRCIAGDDTVQRAISHGDTASQQSSLDLEEDDLKAFSRSLSLSTSPVETQPKEMHSHDYIELVSVPPLPLYALLAADSSSSPILDEVSRDRTSSISADYDEPSTVTATDYSKLFASGLEPPHLSPDMFDTPPKENHNSDTIRRKMNNPSYFGPGQAKLLANYLTRMHLPGLSGQDQMHLLALADTLATTKTEITARGTGTAVTAIGREGAGYADLDNMDNSHAGETLDECGLRYLLAMKFYLCLIKSLPLPQQQQLKRQGLVSSHFIWAFHSEAEEELLSLLPSMQKGEPTWAELRAMGVGWWVRNNTTLRRCMEKVAKSQFQAEKNPLDAALFYLAMKKKTLLWGLFRSIGDEKMTQFFRNDFKQERWRKAALKNAFALLGRQRFEHAAAFFLLAGSLKDAVEVCLNNLGDIQLAMVISRLNEEDLEMPKTQKKIIYEEVLGCDSLGKPTDNHLPHKDPFLRSMAYWLLKDYIKALDTLLLSPSKLTKDRELNGQTKNRADVFNFYNYLRTHPLIVLRQSNDSEIAPSVSKVLAKSTAMDGGSADDEITPEERRLFFATAHMHASAGCPLLALEVLSHLPKVRQGNSEEASERTNGQLISSGTIDEGFMSKSTTGSSFKETAGDFDWSKPSVGLTNGSGGGAGSSVMDFDWSQPVGGRFDEKLELDWGDDPEEDGSNDGDDETMVTENGKDEDGDPNGDREKLGVEEGEELCDIMAQQLKFTCCLKVMMEELRTLATGFEVHGGQLRYQLYVWLERQVETLKLLCNYGPFVQEQGERIEREEEDGDGDLENGPSSLHEMIQARRTDFEDKRQRALRRKRWLHDNHQLIRTILNYSLLYGQNGGGLASVCMELVLLMQEVQQETKVSQQLSSPLPLPTTLPLLSASVASSKTVVADPVLHLRHLIHSILFAVLDFTAPPSPQRRSSTLPALSSLSAALSACIYQSLCDSDTYSSSVSKSKAAGMDVYAGGSANVLYRVGNLVSVNRKRRALSGDVPLTVSSQPSKWPGVATLQALLSSEKDSDLPPMNIQLCEGLLSVYMTLLVRALSTHNTNELYRLMGHQLNERLWASVFGGGAKVRERKQATSQKIVPSNKSVSQQRNKYTLRLMGKASSGRNPTSTSEDKPVQREVFIAPETSIIDYFMVKPHIEAMQGNIDFDSEASDDSSLDDYYDDDDDDEGAFGTKGSTLSSGKNQQEGCDQYSDPTSYSWCLLRYTTIRLVLQKLQTFLPSVGIELAELPVASPILHSILKLLEQWQKALMDRLDLFAGPPAEYLQQCYMVSPNPTMSGPSILRYKGLLEPSNTPFAGTSQAVRSVQRYWNFLVRQEAVQDVFIKYIFEKNKTEETDSAIYTDSGSEGRMKAPPSGKVRIIHKEQDRIPAFCFNQADWRNISLNGEFRSTPTTVVVSTHHGLMELDISLLLEPEVPYWLEEEEDAGVMSRSVSRNTDDDFLLMHTMDNSSSRTSMSKTTSAPFINIPAAAYNDLLADSLSGQTGRGTNVITQRQLPHVRCLAAHPSLPYYLSGSGDGSVHLWEWGHNQKLYTHRGAGQFPKVSQIRVNDQGNKFGVSDENGQLCLWQMGMNNPVVTKPYWSMQCHSKMASDFVFLGSSSFLATAGLSNDNRNICLWDTLMPKRKSMVHTFSCHDGGCPCIMYCPRQQTIISGSKRGEIALFDLRQRKIRQTFQAHESSIRSLAVSPCESFFVSGSAEGNIKVWSLEVHGLLHCFAGQHPKGSFFRPGTTGVLQLAVLQPNYLYSCGADGTLKWRTLPEHHGDQ